ARCITFSKARGRPPSARRGSTGAPETSSSCRHARRTATPTGAAAPRQCSSPSRTCHCSRTSTSIAPRRCRAPVRSSAAPLALAIAAFTMAVENGIVTAFAVLYLPLIREFGASRADVAVVQSAVLLVGGLGGPLIGWAFDRLGPRRLFQLGAIIAAIAFVAASRLTSLLGLVFVYGLVGGLGLAALSSNANMIVAALWYPG